MLRRLLFNSISIYFVEQVLYYLHAHKGQSSTISIFKVLIILEVFGNTATNIGFRNFVVCRGVTYLFFNNLKGLFNIYYTFLRVIHYVVFKKFYNFLS